MASFVQPFTKSLSSSLCQVLSRVLAGSPGVNLRAHTTEGSTAQKTVGHATNLDPSAFQTHGVGEAV